MTIIIWKIIIAGIIVTETIIGAFLGWRVLELMKRVKIMRTDRNRSLEIYTESREENATLSNSLREKGIEIDRLKKERPEFNTLEKKIILVALNKPDIKAEMEEPRISHAMKKAYKNLKQMIKDSF